MTAKLEWDDDMLLIGGLPLDLRLKHRLKGWEVFGSSMWGAMLDERWEDEASARQDVLAGVRRLLKEAGVALEGASETEALQAAWAALDALPNYLKQATEAGTTLHNIGSILAERGVKP